MENILLFAVTLTLYSLVMGCVIMTLNKFSWARFIKGTALMALLALPFNIGGNVFTIAGNATAEKSVYSLFSLYQQAGQDAVTGIGLAYQQAKQDAVTGIGLAVYQKAERKAYVPLAIALYQRVGEKKRAFGAFSSLTKD